MTTNKPQAKVPVDVGEFTAVEDDEWNDDRPDRHFARIGDDPEASNAYQAALAEIRAHQATLAQVRKAQDLTQTTLARLLDMDQSEVSRLERRSDMLLSTLQSYIRAAGGELNLIASFPDDRTPIQLRIGE